MDRRIDECGMDRRIDECGIDRIDECGMDNINLVKDLLYLKNRTMSEE